MANTRQLLDNTVRPARAARRASLRGLAAVITHLRREGAIVRAAFAQQTLDYLTKVSRSRRLTAEQKDARFERALRSGVEQQA